MKKTLGEGSLKKRTSNTITEMDRLEAELEKVRHQGFAIDNEEAFTGISCVAAPLKRKDGEVIAAISATVPKQRMGKERMGVMRQLVKETAQLISERCINGQIG